MAKVVLKVREYLKLKKKAARWTEFGPAPTTGPTHQGSALYAVLDQKEHVEALSAQVGRLTRERDDLVRTRDELQRQLAKKNHPDHGGETAAALRHLQIPDVLRAAVEIVQFAVANLPPETIIGWPHKALGILATNFENTVDCAPFGPPTCTQAERELMREFATFAREAAGHEERRGPRKVGLHGQPTGTRGLETPEAAAVHAAALAMGKDVEV